MDVPPHSDLQGEDILFEFLRLALNFQSLVQAYRSLQMALRCCALGDFVSVLKSEHVRHHGYNIEPMIQERL